MNTASSSASPVSSAGRRLSRGGAQPSPVRIVHLGVGNFFRAHQAWYTQRANIATPDDQWGIAAFTGRAAAIADDLASSEGLYTLVVQGASGNEYEVIGSLSAVHPAGDLDAWRGYLADPRVAIVTSTVTEVGYCRAESGGLDLADPAVSDDVAALRADPSRGVVTTAPGKFVAGLLARRAANPDGAGLTFVPCDNIPENGAMVRRMVTDLVSQLVEADPGLAGWVEANVRYVTTMVDRITPRATDADRAAVLADTGMQDPAAVVTEPFTEWVLSGAFAAGRPAWDAGGARFVDDIMPFETRKLWLLNGSHSLMAYAATVLGHETVYDATKDPRVRGWVEEWWDVAARHLPLPAAEIQAYRDALIERYTNPSIRHLLAQIAADGSQKIAIRIVPALLADRAAGNLPTGATRAVAGWIAHLRGLGAPVNDAHADQVLPLVTGSSGQAVDNVLSYLGIDDDEVRRLVLDQLTDLEGLARG